MKLKNERVKIDFHFVGICFYESFRYKTKTILCILVDILNKKWFISNKSIIFLIEN